MASKDKNKDQVTTMTLIEELRAIRADFNDQKQIESLAGQALERIRVDARDMAATGALNGSFAVVLAAAGFRGSVRSVALVLNKLLEAEGVKPSFSDNAAVVSFSWESLL